MEEDQLMNTIADTIRMVEESFPSIQTSVNGIILRRESSIPLIERVLDDLLSYM